MPFASSFPILLGPGTDLQEFYVSDYWDKPFNATFVLLQLLGAGGGGMNDTASNVVGGGGSGGEFIEYLLLAVDLPDRVLVTIGAGGAGKANGTTGAGATGGTTSFGGLYDAIGGNPGTTAQPGTVPRSSIASTSTSLQDPRTATFPQAGMGGASTLTPADTQYGGGGGGGSGGGTQGYSASFGSGGPGNNTLNTPAGNGGSPGGGGGASGNNGGGGNGGAGYARIITW